MGFRLSRGVAGTTKGAGHNASLVCGVSGIYALTSVLAGGASKRELRTEITHLNQKVEGMNISDQNACIDQRTIRIEI